MQKLGTNPVIKTHALGHIMHICANFFAQISHLINVRNFHSQKRIRCIFYKFSCFQPGKQDRFFDQIQRAVKLPNYFFSSISLHTYNHSVRAHEISDCRAFTQKFRIRGNIKISIRIGFADHLFNLLAGAHRDC